MFKNSSFKLNKATFS